MPTYIANPVRVNGRKIVKVKKESYYVWITLEDGSLIHLDEAMTARYTPIVGDYYVIQERYSYAYINPKKVFETKYHLDVSANE